MFKYKLIVIIYTYVIRRMQTSEINAPTKLNAPAYVSMVLS